MNGQQFDIPAEGISPEQLADWQRQLDGTLEQKAQRTGFQPAARIATRAEVNINNGAITSVTSGRAQPMTVYGTASKPGFIQLPGGGETTVEAAKAGGLIPHTWKDGDALPFDQAPAASQVAPKGAPDDTADKPAGSAHDEHLAKLAGDILNHVDQTHGAHVTDALVDRVADNGDPDSILDQLPDGVSPVQVNQVMAGYIAQANDMLSTVGASVPLLQQMLNDDELRQARRATLSNSPEEMVRLGQAAVDRLAQMPTSDPDTFREMVEGMDPKARQMIRHDRNSGHWVVTLPGHPSMTYGAAVRLGLVKV